MFVQADKLSVFDKILGERIDVITRYQGVYTVTLASGLELPALIASTEIEIDEEN